MKTRTALIIGGTLGLLGVLAGTFGAHGLEGRVEADLLETYETGARYHLYHALAIVACATLVPRWGRLGTAAIICFALGVGIFAGSLYLLALTGERWLGAITPIGGVLFTAGWSLVIAAGWRGKD